MATYVLPQVQVFQEFTEVPVATQIPLRAHISGGHAYLVRFAETDEKEDGKLDYYDDLADEAFIWPNRPAGAVVDQDYTQIWVENALLQYFEDTVGSGSTITKVASKPNEIRSDTINWKTNGAFARDALLFDRDVAVGDVIKTRFVPGGGDPVTLWSTVKGFVGDVVAASTGDPTADSANATVGSVSGTISQIAGPYNCVGATTDGTAYDGLPTGQITETYTVTVTESSANGDLTQAKLRVTSASGLDDEDDVVPSAVGSATDIGALGLTMTFTEDDTQACSDSASDQGVAQDDLLVGQKWEIVVEQDYTVPTPADGGTYTGSTDTTYVIEVTRGAEFAATNKPQISVTTTTGVDISGPTNVASAAAAIVVGTEGVTIAFTAATPGLAKGDRWYIIATAETEGAMKTIQLNHNIPSTVSDGDETDVTLFILKPSLQITENRTGAAPLVNWTTSATEITLKVGITAFDSTWTDSGTLLALPLKSDSSQDYGCAFVQYRAWRQELVGAVGSIASTTTLDTDILGATHPDNPLKWAVSKALANANGVAVKYTAVEDPDDSTKWQDVLDLLLGRDDIYGLVPLTRDSTVLGLFESHVNALSLPAEGLWRVAWFALSGKPEIPIVHAGSTVPRYVTATTSDAAEALATIGDDPDTSGTQYTIVTVPAGNADFITNGVKAGDIVRAIYTGDGFGNFTYTEFVVDAVQTEDQLRLVSGPAAEITVASKIEVWRNLTATEEATEIGLDAAAYDNTRIRAVWPDTIESSGTTQEGFHLAAALAGLRSGVLPHQGMTHLEITGFSDVSRTTDKFNKNQLDSMASRGIWIVTQDPIDLDVFTRHAITTGDVDVLNEREEMIVSNVDSISYRHKDYFAGYIGIANVTPSTIEQMRLDEKALIEVLKNENNTGRLGGQLTDATIVEIVQHATLLDRVRINVNITIPAPVNNIDVELVI